MAFLRAALCVLPAVLGLQGCTSPLIGLHAVMLGQQAAPAPKPTAPRVYTLSTDDAQKFRLFLRTFKPVAMTPDGVKCEWSCEVKNETGQQVDSVALDLTVDQGNDEILKMPVVFSHFEDEDLGYSGTLLPWSRCWLKTTVTMPVDAVQKMTGYWMEVKTVTARFPFGEVKDAGRWFSFILNYSDKDIERELDLHPELATMKDSTSGVSAVQIACAKNHASLVKYFMSKGAHLDTVSANGVKPIHVASMGCPEVLSFLLQQGADPNSKAADGRSPALYAAKYGCTQALEILGKAGADLDCEDAAGERPLWLAANNQDPAPARVILKHHPKVGFFGPGRVTALHVAAQRDNVVLIDALLDAGAEVNAMHIRDGFTPLDTAAKHGSLNALRELLKRGADPNMKTINDHTALDLSVRYSQREAFEILKPVTSAELNLDFRGDVRLGTKAPKTAPSTGSGLGIS